MKIRYTVLAHISHGALAGFLWWIDFRLSLFLFLQFFLYEYFEESKIKDELYHELKEWALGFILGLMSMFLLILLPIPFSSPPLPRGGGGSFRGLPRLM